MTQYFGFNFKMKILHNKAIIDEKRDIFKHSKNEMTIFVMRNRKQKNLKQALKILFK